MNLTDNIGNVTTVLKGCIVEEFKAREALTIMQKALQVARNEIIVKHADDPKVLGSNEAARNAKIESMLKTELDNVELAQKSVDVARLNTILAQLDFDGIKLAVKALYITE